jgi:hypothetical protein
LVGIAAGLTNFEKHAPPLPISYGVMHSKAVIIEYEQGVRVIIHTSNLLYIDSNNKTQGIWVRRSGYVLPGYTLYWASMMSDVWYAAVCVGSQEPAQRQPTQAGCLRVWFVVVRTLARVHCWHV